MILSTGRMGSLIRGEKMAYRLVYLLMVGCLGGAVGLAAFNAWQKFPIKTSEEPEAFVVFDENIVVSDEQTLDERLQALQNTISACCGTETRDLAVDEEVEYLKKLEKRVEELEIRFMILEELLEGLDG